ncbi:hypothetical protein ACFC0K_29065 [Streptomyces hydrogenans]|uniref:hypothetical protein n=1 Tax=Streptomyces hydrogenans TaxID=1873719 RepID=UPI0035E27108
MNKRNRLPADVAELLAAVVAALDLPLPAVEYGADREHYRLLERRSADVRIALGALLCHPEYPDLRDDAAYLRGCTAEHPITYTPFLPSTGEEG